MKNSAFSLVEFTVYLALFSFISVLFLGVASRVQFKFMNVSSEQENLHRQTIALDLLKRDLMSASQYCVDWDLQQAISEKSFSHQAVFKKLTLTDKNLPQSVAVSWFIGNQGLMRAQGEYDFVKHEWIHKTSCIVCKSIKNINFVLQNLHKQEGKSGCSGVWVVYKSIGSEQTSGQAQKIFDQKFFIKFRNRVVA